MCSFSNNVGSPMSLVVISLWNCKIRKKYEAGNDNFTFRLTNNEII